MDTADFDYALPEGLIAHHPAARRETSRLLVADRRTRSVSHRRFLDFPSLLQAGDVLVLNDSRVIPARIRGVKPESGGRIEALLCRENAKNDWWVLLRPAKRLRPGHTIEIFDRQGLPCGVRARVLEKNEEGHVRLGFLQDEDIARLLDSIGEIPLPPYIRRDGTGPLPADAARYQTVYAAASGSLAAPTAGLHYTPEILAEIRARGVEVVALTLHVGLGTFAPVKSERVEDHVMHEERFELPAATALVLNRARQEKRRVVSGGTTVTRVLETLAAREDDGLAACAGTTRIFLRPPCDFRCVGALQTNFHLPKSTLLMLVCAFAAPGGSEGVAWIMDVYREAIRENYRFFSYGDTMLVT